MALENSMVHILYLASRIYYIFAPHCTHQNEHSLNITHLSDLALSVLHKRCCSSKICWEDPAFGGARVIWKRVHYQVKYVTWLLLLLRQEYKVPLHSFKKAPRCLASSSFESLGFDVLPKPSSIASKTHESVSGKSRPRDNGIIAGGPYVSNTEPNRPVSSRNTVRYVVSVARRLVSYQCKKNAAYC